MFGVFISSAGGIAVQYLLQDKYACNRSGRIGGIFMVIMQQNTMLMTWPLSLALLLAGVVCTSRMIVSDHRPKEIYTGFFVGLLCQFIGAIINLQ
jgi:hypothetical protein